VLGGVSLSLSKTGACASAGGTPAIHKAPPHAGELSRASVTEGAALKLANFGARAFRSVARPEWPTFQWGAGCDNRDAMKTWLWRGSRSLPPWESIPAPENDVLRGMAASISKEQGVDRKRRLLDMLDDACRFSAPKWMVEDEFHLIWSLVESDRKAGKLDPIDARKSVRQLRAEYHAIADRRVRLGLVLNVIGRRNNITAKEYPWGPPADVKEDKIVDFIFALSS